MASASLGTVLRHVRRLAVPGGEDLSDADLLQAFLRRQDPEAFEVLVRRHGPMVLHLCRRLLHQREDAEDAFQATFLILARKAGSVRKGAALASWLYGVAYRLALGIRRAAARRRMHEGRARTMTTRDPSDDLAWREVQVLLEDEIQRLPETYRAVFVLCYLEGKSRAEVAQGLRLKEGTVSSRLARACAQLRARLVRRGVVLSSLLAATALARRGDGALLPTALVTRTSRAVAGLVGKAGTGAELVSPRVAALVEGGLTTMSAARKVLATGLVLTLGLLAGSTGLLGALPGSVGQPAGEQASEVPVSSNPPGNSAQAADKSVRTDLQGDPLPPGALVRFGSLRFRHVANVQALAFLPGGRVVATAAGTEVHLWEAATGQERARLRADPSDDEAPTPRRPDWIRALACSPDGTTLAAGFNEGQVQLWDVATKKPLRSWRSHPAPPRNSVDSGGVLEMLFGADGQTLITAGLDKSLRVWDTRTGRQVRQLTGHQGTPCALSLSPDGTLLACSDFMGGATGPGQVRLWQLATGEKIHDLRGPDHAPATCLAFPSDGKRLAAGFGMMPQTEAEIRIWDLAGPKELATLKGHAGQVAGLRFSADGRTLRSAGIDGTVRDWDLTAGAERKRTTIPWGGVARALLTPDGKEVISYGYGALHFWNAETGREQPWSVGSDWPVIPACSPDGTHLATADGIGPVRLWDLTTGREVRHFGGALERWPHFSADGKTLWAVALDADGSTGVACLHDTATGEERRRLKIGPYLQFLAFSDDPRFLAAGGSTIDPVAHVCDLVAGKQVQRIALPPLCSALALSPDGRTLAAVAQANGFAPTNCYLHLWDVATGKLLHEMERTTDAQVFTATFSPDGRTLASAGLEQGSEPVVKLWDVASGRLRLRMRPGNNITGLAFSPNGLLLALLNNGGYVGTGERPKNHTIVRLVDSYTGQELHRFAGHRAAVTAARFSADGARLVTASQDTTALLWDIPPSIRRGAPLAGRLTDQERQALWEQLASANEAAAYRAMSRLRAAGPTFLADALLATLRPNPQADAWIADLDSPRFAVREKAENELDRPGAAAEGSLRKALAGKLSAEARRRITHRLEKWGGVETVRAPRTIEVLEHLDTPEARAALDAIAGTAHGHLASQARAASERMARRTVHRP